MYGQKALMKIWKSFYNFVITDNCYKTEIIVQK